MKIYVDSTNCIHDVDSTENPTLKELVINDDDNPFKGWTIAKICCYRAFVDDGFVTCFTPYVPSSIIDHIDQLGKENERLMELNAQQAIEIEGLGDAIIEMSEIIYA